MYETLARQRVTRVGTGIFLPGKTFLHINRALGKDFQSGIEFRLTSNTSVQLMNFSKFLQKANKR